MFIFIVLFACSVLLDLRNAATKKQERPLTATIFLLNGTTAVLVLLLLIGYRPQMPTNWFNERVAPYVQKWLEEVDSIGQTRR
jgi:hypothetical protein